MAFASLWEFSVVARGIVVKNYVARCRRKDSMMENIVYVSGLSR